MADKNPFMCDYDAGLCGVGPKSVEKITPTSIKEESPLRVVYYTDPICSACWAIEGALRKLRLEYGHEFVFDCHMGGLLPAFGKGYDPGDFYKPEDLAKHWDEASAQFRVPINGNVWLKDPLSSSFPPSIAFKAAQLQSEVKAEALLRLLREKLFVQSLNVSENSIILEAAEEVGLDVVKLKEDIKGEGNINFHHDLELGEELGIRGFPTFLFLNLEGDHRVLFGVHPYPDYEKYILKLNPKAVKASYDKDPLALLKRFGSLTVKELSVLAEYGYYEAEQDLDKLEKEGRAKVIVSPNGKLWKLK